MIMYYRPNTMSWDDVCKMEGIGKITITKPKPKPKMKPKPSFSNGLKIDRVIYNDPATIVLWNDGTKTIAKAEHGDKFNKEVGFNVCLLKKLMGNKKYHDFMDEYVFKDGEA